jgi:tetratricopeptide (TPR) repeat protein
MVDAYLRSDSTASTAPLSEWPADRLAMLLATIDTSVDPRKPWSAQRWAAATLLLTDTALQQDENLQGQAFVFVNFATGILALSLRTDMDARRPFARAWYQSLARYLRARNEPDAARELLALGRQRMRGDAAILAESGLVAEWAASEHAYVFRGRPVTKDRLERAIDIDRTRQERTRMLNDALQWLRESRRLEPGSDLLDLHLGRVHAMRGDDAEALGLLAAVAARTPDAATAYLAETFAGGVHERAGRLDEAAAAYRRALSRYPRGHAACIGLSEVLHRTGQPDEARGILSALLLETRGRTIEPRWWYLYDPPGVSEQRLDELRKAVRR